MMAEMLLTLRSLSSRYVYVWRLCGWTEELVGGSSDQGHCCRRRNIAASVAASFLMDDFLALIFLGAIVAGDEKQVGDIRD